MIKQGGTYAEMQALTNPVTGVEFVVNSGASLGTYEYRGGTAGWVQTHDASGAAHASAQNSAAWIFPSSWFVNHSGTATGTADNTVVMETNDVSMYNHHEFSIFTAPGASAVEVLVSHDGTNYETIPIQVFDRALVEGAVVQGLAQLTAIGNYYFNGKYAKWKIQNNGITAANTAARGSSSVM